MLDEMGALTDEKLAYGRSKRGTRAYSKTPHRRGKRTSLVGVIGPNGRLTAHAVIGHYNRDTFEDFIEVSVIPKLRRGDTLCMDNASIHKGWRLKQMLRRAGIRLRYFPAYSPKFNPIELAWSTVRRVVQTIGGRTMKKVHDALVEGWKRITKAHCRAYYKHALSRTAFV